MLSRACAVLAEWRGSWLGREATSWAREPPDWV
jgi:hypothetical protein